MLESCREGLRPIRLCVEKTKNFDQIQPPRTWRQKWTKILFWPISPKFEAPWVESLPYMLETCREGPRPIRLCVEKAKNSDQIEPPRTWRQKWTKILIGLFPPNLKPLQQRVCPTCLKLAGKALGLLGCVLKRLKILTKFNHHGPGGKNGPKFWSARFPQIWSPLSRGSALHA